MQLGATSYSFADFISRRDFTGGDVEGKWFVPFAGGGGLLGEGGPGGLARAEAVPAPQPDTSPRRQVARGAVHGGGDGSGGPAAQRSAGVVRGAGGAGAALGGGVPPAVGGGAALPRPVHLGLGAAARRRALDLLSRLPPGPRRLGQPSPRLPRRPNSQSTPLQGPPLRLQGAWHRPPARPPVGSFLILTAIQALH